MRSWKLAILASGLLVAACSKGPTDPAVYNDSAKIPAADNRAEAAIENVVSAQGPSALAPGVPAPKAADSKKLPPGFQGKWGLVAADCEFGRSDAKGLLTIDGDTLHFYESRAKVKSLVERSGKDVTVNLDVSGEGQTWTTHTVLTLTPTGTGLLRVEQSPTATYHYNKC